MNIKRQVKWSPEALTFFKSQNDSSIDLTVIISRANESQTGDGFEELVNSINSEYIKKKINKVIILDTTFLYRHCIPEYAMYSDINLPTIWLLTNRSSIKKIECIVEMQCWFNQVNSDAFNHWYKQIKKDFAGDENGEGIVPEFRKILLEEIETFVSKGKGTHKECSNFLLEEYSHTCAFLKNTAVVYPRPFSPPMENIIERYNLNMRCLNYNLSNYTRTHQHNTYGENKINAEIISLTRVEDLNMNFFVTNKTGKYIYKNSVFSEVIGNMPYVTDPIAWEISLNVMKSRKRVVLEEQNEGKYYLSVKAPLVIKDKVEGVIGLAVDITDRKKAEQLELQNKLLENNRILTEQVVHDIRSPLAALSMLAEGCKNLSEKEDVALKEITASIDNIASNLLKKHNEDKTLSNNKIQTLCVHLNLLNTINSKKYQYKKSNVVFNYSYDVDCISTFIKGNYSDFSRMMSNLINNSVEAIEGKKGVININFTVNNRRIEVQVKDNGKGIPQKIVDKIKNNINVGSTKDCGHGIGLQQVQSTLRTMNGKMQMESTENVGTKITLDFPEFECPEWFTTRIELKRGGHVIVLDDNISAHDIWRAIFKNYTRDINVEYFTQGTEVIDFVNSLKEKNNIFLLVNWELKHQNISGEDVIKKCDLQKQSILIVSDYAFQIDELNEKRDLIKVLPKSYISDIPITVSTKKAVLIDDCESFTDVLRTVMEEREFTTDVYNDATVFLRVLHKYSKDTNIVADYDLKQKINGFDLLKKAYELGYQKLFILSGKNFEEADIPSYITIKHKSAIYKEEFWKMFE
ncbi:MAG: HAMP domain-containing histidine kinase [Holosporaceae bacterium]|jgi:signal transduction histidine kinase/FixJ family two-component response regulator|nr:HAMP domain-containing histidine kinase [Holosporaceae bacterium]